MQSTKIWAHRGASSLAPENTLEAFSLANELFADGIELDVHLSSDGELIVAHDETVDRCTSGTGRIIDMTLAELRQLDFSNHKPNYRGVKVPTLKEVYDFIKTTNMTVNVEIKSGIVLYEGIEQALVDLAKSMGMQERVLYSSFNHYSLMQLKAINPAARIAPLYGEALFEPWHYAKQIGACAIHPHYATLIAPGFMQGLARADILCNAWTVDGEKELATLMRMGVNALITNKPDLALSIRKSLQ